MSDDYRSESLFHLAHLIVTFHFIFVYHSTISGHWQAAAFPVKTRQPLPEQGFPGNLDINVTYSFDDDQNVRIEYRLSLIHI